MYLLDTNVVSELRHPRPHGAVLEWISDVPADQLYVSAVTVGEIQAGIEITRGQDEAKAEGAGSLAGQGPDLLRSVADGRSSVSPVGTADAPKVRHPDRGCHDRGDGHRSPADGGYEKRG